jgi:TatD DNase family protein
MWIDSHCHLDAAEFAPDRDAVVARVRAAGVDMLVLPAVAAFDFEAVRELAHQHRFAYALGIHPLFTMQADEQDLMRLDQLLGKSPRDPRLVAIGEIGLDFFVPGLDAERQQFFYLEQLRLARKHQLPVILHVRRSADLLLKGLRAIPVSGGIAHAFNGSAQQAVMFIQRGFKLGFGGTLTFERSQQIRRLAQTVSASALVLETDSPDMPPQWLYQTAAQRAGVGADQGSASASSRNEPAELPRIAQSLADLRGWTLEQTAAITSANVHAALPRLSACND